MNILSVVAFACAFAAVFHAHRAVAQVRKQAEETARTAREFSIREEVQREFWKSTAESWQKMYEQMHDALALLQAEHTALLKAIAPEYIVQRAHAALTGEEIESKEDNTPSVGEADRRAAVARREKLERERRIREEGYQPLVVGDAGTEPPHRLDATAHDDSDADGE